MVYNVKWLPKGEGFLPDCSKEELERLYEVEVDPKAKVRLIAAINRKEGKSIPAIGRWLKCPTTTVKGWLSRMHKFGLGARYNKKQPGNKPNLGKRDLVRLKRIIAGSPEKQGLDYAMWNNKLTQHVIRKEFGVKFSLSHVGRILKKIGFSMKKPRPENKKASKKAQEKFKPEVKKSRGEFQVRV